MLTATLIAHLINLPATATAAYEATCYMETVHAVRAERHDRAEALGAWLNRLDGERIRALSVWTPFAEAREVLAAVAKFWRTIGAKGAPKS